MNNDIDETCMDETYMDEIDIDEYNNYVETKNIFLTKFCEKDNKQYKYNKSISFKISDFITNEDKLKRIHELYNMQNYNYIKNNEDILNIPIGHHIIYVNKESLIKKTGYLKEIKDKNYIKVRYYWISTEQNFIFHKLKMQTDNLFKESLRDLLESNFTFLKK